MKTKKVYIIRHGQSTGNANGRFDIGEGQDSELLLTDLGEEQSRILGKLLKEEIPIVNHIFCSPYKRATLTFYHFCETYSACSYKPLTYETRIRERTVYNYPNIKSEFRDNIIKADPYASFFYGSANIESMAQVCDRASSFLGTLERINLQGTILVFCHKKFAQAFDFVYRNQQGEGIRPEELEIKCKDLKNCEYNIYEL